jgi:hypothetical protein
VKSWLATFKGHGGAVDAPPFPSGEDIARNVQLPKQLGSLVFVPLESDTAEYEDQYQRVARLREENEWMSLEAQSALANSRAVCSELRQQLSALTAVDPDLARGSGRGNLARDVNPASGGPGGSRVGCVDVAALSDAEQRLFAAGMASVVHDGLLTFESITTQLEHLVDGLALLPVAGTKDRRDDMRRSWLSRHGTGLLRGTLSPASWAAFAVEPTDPEAGDGGGGAPSADGDDDECGFDGALEAEERLVNAQRQLDEPDEAEIDAAATDAVADEAAAEPVA